MASVSPRPVVDERPRPRTLPWPWHHGRSGDVLGQGHTTTTAVANWRWGNHIFSWLFAPRGPFLNLTPSLSLLNTIRFFYYLATKSLVYKMHILAGVQVCVNLFPDVLYEAEFPAKSWAGGLWPWISPLLRWLRSLVEMRLGSSDSRLSIYMTAVFCDIYLFRYRPYLQFLDGATVPT